MRFLLERPSTLQDQSGRRQREGLPLLKLLKLETKTKSLKRLKNFVSQNLSPKILKSRKSKSRLLWFSGSSDYDQRSGPFNQPAECLKIESKGNKMKKALIIATLFGLFLSSSFGGFVLTLENDFFGDSDDNYSHGTEIEYNYWKHDGFTPYRVGLGVNQLMFTPQDIGEPDLPPMTDRPWCGTLSVYYELWHRTNHEDVRTRFEIGVLGPSSGAENSQVKVHEWLDCKTPMGWDHQMPDELMANIYHERYYRLWSQNIYGRWGYDIKPLYGFTFGTTYMNLRAGGQSRFGYNIPLNSFPGGIAPKVVRGQGLVLSDPGFFVYVVGSVEEMYVAHNATLGESYFENRESGQERELESMVFTYRYGLVTGIKNFSFSYMWEERSEEFKEETDGGMGWGMIRLEFLYQF